MGEINHVKTVIEADSRIKTRLTIKNGSITKKETEDVPKSKIAILFENNEPAAGVYYEFRADGQKFVTGNANQEGVIEVHLPLNVSSIELHTLGDVYDIIQDQLKPITTVEGIQARLNNLGYNSGIVDGIVGPLTSQALKEFQTDHGLEADGQINDETRLKLEQVSMGIELTTVDPLQSSPVSAGTSDNSDVELLLFTDEEYQEMQNADLFSQEEPFEEMGMVEFSEDSPT